MSCTYSFLLLYNIRYQQQPFWSTVNYCTEYQSNLRFSVWNYKWNRPSILCRGCPSTIHCNISSLSLALICLMSQSTNRSQQSQTCTLAVTNQTVLQTWNCWQWQLMQMHAANVQHILHVRHEHSASSLRCYQQDGWNGTFQSICKTIIVQ